jgi:3-dehydroquinate dehydratase
MMDFKKEAEKLSFALLFTTKEMEEVIEAIQAAYKAGVKHSGEIILGSESLKHIDVSIRRDIAAVVRKESE